MRVFFIFLVCFLFAFSFVLSQSSSSTEVSFFIDPDSSDLSDTDVSDKGVGFDLFYSFVVILVATVLYFIVRKLRVHKRTGKGSQRKGKRLHKKK